MEQRINEVVGLLNVWSNSHYSYSTTNGGYRLWIDNQPCSTVVSEECLLKRLEDDLNHYLFD